MDEKNCAKCGGLKPVDEFYRRKNGFLSDLCRKHFLERRKEYVRDFREKKLPDRVKLMQRVLAVYKDRPCMDCGRSFPTFAMDLDHRNPDMKKASTADLVRRCATVEAFKAEIELCDVVCAVCHRIRTHDKDHYRMRPKRTHQRRSRSLLRTRSSGHPPP
jgi:hypothetical protein